MDLSAKVTAGKLLHSFPYQFDLLVRRTSHFQRECDGMPSEAVEPLDNKRRETLANHWGLSLQRRGQGSQVHLPPLR